MRTYFDEARWPLDKAAKTMIGICILAFSVVVMLTILYIRTQ
jgi:hypothetical protein